MKKLMALDGNNLLHRAFYALPLMETPDGTYTNAVYGFMSMLIRLVADYTPDYLAVAFDMHAPTFRHIRYEQYKAGRKETPHELRPQMDLLKNLLEEVGIAALTCEGYEADDILGTLSRMASEHGIQALLVTGDRDAFQLISRNVHVLYTHRGVTDVDELDADALKEKFGYYPERALDMKALMGDTSDNIPGIPGVGPKTALTLVEKFATLDDILARPEEALKGAMLKKVQAGADSAKLSRELAEIRVDTPIKEDIDSLALPELRSERVYTALEKLGMKSLIERLRRGAAADTPPQPLATRRKRGQLVMLRDENTARQWLAGLNGPTAITLGRYIEVADTGKHARLCLREDLLEEGMEPEQAYSLLSERFKGESVYYHDAKKAMCSFTKHNAMPPEILGDAFIAGYLLLPTDVGLTLPAMGRKLFSEECGDGAGDLLDISLALEEGIIRDGLEELYRRVELPLIRVLFDMEREGFEIDAKALHALGEKYDAEMTALQDDIYKLAGESFNINSPKQLGLMLFEKLGLPPTKKTKSGYSTDADVLEQLEHPIGRKVLEYRTLSKLKGTYVDGLLGVVDSGGRVHTTFNQTVTATGRISSADPNLQNIPVRTELGREIRDVFIAGGDGHVLVDADYSQIELRVLAHMSGDENMREAFRLGQDIHARTASEIFGVSIDDVTPFMRSSAKAVNFGVVYGISDYGLARNTGISRAEAKDFIAAYFARYPQVRKFMDECVSKGKTDGSVRTMMGRRRFMPELTAVGHHQRAFGERAAMNTPIQGTAADIIKLAMVRVADALKKEGLCARLILQVHDELIVRAPRDEAEHVRTLLVREMEGAAELSVPLVVDVGIGDTWNAAK